MLQFEVDVFGATAEDMKMIEKVVGTPFAHHRLHIAPADRHFGGHSLTQFLQINPHVGFAFHQTRILDVGVGFGYYGVVYLPTIPHVVEC